MDPFSGTAATLSNQATKALGDSKYDKRKSGALEVEGVIKALVAEQRRTGVSCHEGVSKVCRRLANDFIVSSDPNQRKGGLIGIAAVAIGLEKEVGGYLDLLLPPVLKCFDDPESRVRYYATEALYNVCKVARGSLLIKAETHFNPVFHGLCKVFADVDPEVKNGAQLLDRLLKVIVAESERFNIDEVVPLLHSYLKVKNPFIRQLLVSWIASLDSVPDLELVKRLPALLDGLFDMLSDSNKSIRDSSDKMLQVFLKEIQEHVGLYKKTDLIPKTVDICLRRRNDTTRAVRSTCMHWLGEMLILHGEGLVDRFADFLKAVIDGVSEGDDSEDGEIVKLAVKCDLELQNIARSTPQGKNVDEKNLSRVISQHLNHNNRMVREACLNWTSLLLDTIPDRLQTLHKEMVPGLVEALRDPVDEIISLALAALARVARNSKSCDGILNDVLNKFETDRALLEGKGSFIIRKLCQLLQSNIVYLVLAKILIDKKDVDFASLFVQTLNVILLTAAELSDLRATLRLACSKTDTSSEQQEEEEIHTFDQIFRAWCHSPVSALCLCLLGGAYELSSRLVEILGESEITVDVLVDCDRLVRLLESPVMMHVRMQLLKNNENFEPDLLKSLYGLLMLLPQKSDAFKTLDARLGAISAMHLTLAQKNLTPPTKTTNQRYDELLRHFSNVRRDHFNRRAELLAQNTLLV